jgi:hypothetical protein
MKTRLQKTLLQSLMIERHLTREQAIEALDRRARDMGVRDFALSLRQLDRWLAGDLATLPRPSLCRVVEAEFGYPVRRLLAVGGPLVEPPSSPQPQGPRVQSAVTSGEVESVLDVTARMGWLGSVNAEDSTLDLLHAVAEDIIARYGAEGPSRLAPEVVRLRRHVQELLRGHQHPQQRLGLYALAGRLSAMLGYMAVNQARFMLAQAYCAEAFALASAAEDADLQAWVRGTESLSAYYQQRYADALELARDGQRHAHGGPQSIRLAINGEARALGRLGDRRGVDEAVERAYAGVSRLPSRAGMSPCISLAPYSEARVAANAATAYLSLGATSRVLDYAARIEAPVEESDVDWDRSLVRLDVATALIRQRRPDMEYAAEVATTALQASAGNPIESIRQRASEFVSQARQWQGTPAVREFTEAFHGWSSSTLPTPGPEAS